MAVVLVKSKVEECFELQYSLEQPEIEKDFNEIFDEVAAFIERVKEIIKKGKKPDWVNKGNSLQKGRFFC